MTPATGAIPRAQATLLHFLDRHAAGWADDPRTIAGARALSAGYTAGERRTPPLTGPLRTAYLAYFAPRTLSAVGAVLAPLGPLSSVVDVGAGLGAGALVAVAQGARAVFLHDHDPRALDSAEALLRSYAEPVQLQRGSLDDALARAGSSDLLLFAFSLVEIAAHHRDADAFFERILAAARRCPVVIVDGGDRHSARIVQTLRDLAVDAGITIRAPCPHTGPCPALSRKRDWCHTSVPRLDAPRRRAFARAVGRDDARMALSYLVLDPESSAAPHAVRVIGEPRKEKGRVRLPVCGPDGLRFIQALNRHEAAADALRQLPRGQPIDTLPGDDRREDVCHVQQPIRPGARGVWP